MHEHNPVQPGLKLEMEELEAMDVPDATAGCFHHVIALPLGPGPVILT